MKTKCTHCGIETNNQPAGDGCHACCRGTMRKILALIMLISTPALALACHETLGEKCVKVCLDHTLITTPSHYDTCRKGCKKNPKRTICLSNCFVETVLGNDPKFSPDACKDSCG